MTSHDSIDGPYWHALDEGCLRLPRCQTCQRWVWPARHRCSDCGSVGLQWQDVPLRATVFSWTRTWHRFALTETLPLPFTTVLARIDGTRIRLLGHLDDPDKIDPVMGEAIVGRIGHVEVQGRTLPCLFWRRGT